MQKTQPALAEAGLGKKPKNSQKFETVANIHHTTPQKQKMEKNIKTIYKFLKYKYCLENKHISAP